MLSEHLVDFWDDTYAGTESSLATHWEDRDQIRDGVLARAKDQMIEVTSQWRVGSDSFEETRAEMINATGKTWIAIAHIGLCFLAENMSFSCFSRPPIVYAASTQQPLSQSTGPGSSSVFHPDHPDTSDDHPTL